MRCYFLVISVFVLTACKNEGDSANEMLDESEPTEAEVIVNQAIDAHGGDNYAYAHYQFTFRDRDYTFHNNDDQFEYTRIYRPHPDTTITDIMDNDHFSRLINGSETAVSQEMAGKYQESINSVIYFATLPHKLQDASVNKSYLGADTIQGNIYDVVRVTFDKEGGGKDFQDEYMYWFDQESHFMDFLAYNYQTNGGGARLRVAYNQRTVDGIRFQDYENYAAPFEEPLKNLPQLYTLDSLELVSLIETENIQTVEK